MQIFFKNESDKTVILCIAKETYTLIPDAGKHIETDNTTCNFSVTANLNYRCEPMTGKLGLSYFHRFILTSEYTLAATDNCTVRLYSETAHGNNFESYNRIYPFSTDCKISLPVYTVNDENEIKEKIKKSDKNETAILQGAGVAGKLIKAKNIFDDIITVAILGIIAIIAFILIWIFRDFKTAVMIFAGVSVSGLLLWKLFLEKMINKAKAKAKKKAESTIEKIFLPCENMPEGIFRDKNSYFSNDYIAAVFKHSTKRT